MNSCILFFNNSSFFFFVISISFWINSNFLSKSSPSIFLFDLIFSNSSSICAKAFFNSKFSAPNCLFSSIILEFWILFSLFELVLIGSSPTDTIKGFPFLLFISLLLFALLANCIKKLGKTSFALSSVSFNLSTKSSNFVLCSFNAFIFSRYFANFFSYFSICFI